MFQKVRMILTTGVLLCAMTLGVSAVDGIKAGVVDVAGSLNLRSEPNTNCEVLKKLADNTDLCVFDQSEGFYKVSAGGTVGYVSTEFVTLKDIMNISDGGGAKVATGVLNMRESPSLDGGIVTKLSEGSVAEIIGINSGWLKVKADGYTGYISPDYVNYVCLNSESRAPQPVAQSSGGEEVVSYAKKFLGTPYVYGGSGPSGFDCSGFTSYVYRQFGISLNRSSGGQTGNGYKIERSQLAPGDLVFFGTPSSPNSVHHVGIYIGGGKFIHAVKPGKALAVETMSGGYYNNYYWGARRVL